MVAVAVAGAIGMPPFLLLEEGVVYIINPKTTLNYHKVPYVLVAVESYVLSANAVAGASVVAVLVAIEGVI